MFSVKITARHNTKNEEKIRQCNLKATKFIDVKNYNEAIELLKTAQKLMPKVSTEYPLAQYLRLALIQQKAGLFSDSVNNLKQYLVKRNNPFDKALVHDKLRLVYQREKINDTAIVHAISSLAWECLGFSCQDRDYSIYQNPDIWIKKIKTLLKKIKKDDAMQSITSKCVSYSEEPTKENIEAVVNFTKQAIKNN